MRISEPGYDRTRRACTPCAAHLSAGDDSCPVRYAVAIAAPGVDMYHRHAAVRYLSAEMETAAKKAAAGVGGGGGMGEGGKAGGGRIIGPLEAVERVHGGPRALFTAIAPLLSAEVRVLFFAAFCLSRGVVLFELAQVGLDWVELS